MSVSPVENTTTKPVESNPIMDRIKYKKIISDEIRAVGDTKILERIRSTVFLILQPFLDREKPLYQIKIDFIHMERSLEEMNVLMEELVKAMFYGGRPDPRTDRGMEEYTVLGFWSGVRDGTRNIVNAGSGITSNGELSAITGLFALHGSFSLRPENTAPVIARCFQTAKAKERATMNAIK